MKKLVTALALMIATTVCAGDFEDAVAAHDIGDFKAAVSSMKKAAAQGDSRAQYNLALMYKNGEGVVQDYAEAARWYKLSAAQGYLDAQYNLAVMYNRGDGVVQNYKKAHMWWNLVAVNGNDDAVKNREMVAKKMTAQQVGEAQKMATKCMANKFKDCD
jgi:hypothetical protein